MGRQCVEHRHSTTVFPYAHNGRELRTVTQRMDQQRRVMSPFRTVQGFEVDTTQWSWISVELGLPMTSHTDLEYRLDTRVAQSRDFVGMVVTLNRPTSRAAARIGPRGPAIGIRKPAVSPEAAERQR